jgi:hypothetical protein
VFGAPAGLTRIALGARTPSYSTSLIKGPVGAKPSMYQSAWGIDGGSQIWRLSSTGWGTVPGSLSHIATAADGTTVGINSQGEAFRWVRNAFQSLDSNNLDPMRWYGICAVGPAPAAIIGIDANGLWRHNGMSWVSILPGFANHMQPCTVSGNSDGWLACSTLLPEYSPAVLFVRSDGTSVSEQRTSPVLMIVHTTAPIALGRKVLYGLALKYRIACADLLT